MATQVDTDDERHGDAQFTAVLPYPTVLVRVFCLLSSSVAYQFGRVLSARVFGAGRGAHQADRQLVGHFPLRSFSDVAIVILHTLGHVPRK